MKVAMAETIAVRQIRKDTQCKVAQIVGEMRCKVDSPSEIIVEIGEVLRCLNLVHFGMCSADRSTSPKDGKRVATEKDEQILAVNSFGDYSATPVDGYKVEEFGSRVPISIQTAKRCRFTFSPCCVR